MFNDEVTKDEYYLNLVSDWTDPYPSPVLEIHNGFHIVRDDLLKIGSKSRFADYFIRTSPEKEFVVGAVNKVGWGPASLAYLCRKYDKKAVIFAAKRETPTPQQQVAIDFGADFHWIANGMMNVTKARAEEYVAEDKQTRRILPMGLNHPMVLASIMKVARSIGIQPKEVWCAGGSGTLTRGLQLAWPDAKHHVVQIGHKLSKEEIGEATKWECPIAYDRPIKPKDAPPFDSALEYDAKVWKYMCEHGSPGSLMWNVAGALKTT